MNIFASRARGIAVSAAILVTVTCWAAGVQAQERSDGTAIEEIIVKGLKRDSKLIDAPVSAQVFTETTIDQAGITRPQDFLALTPNVTFLQSNLMGDTFINIRGQTTVRNSDANVAMVIDGVQYSIPLEFNGELFDIQQIEVLKGPQGALYGRNAAAGAIVITTKEPSDEFEGRIKGSYGNWNSSKFNASVGGPIVAGKLRFRASMSVNDTDGPYTDISSGRKVRSNTEKLGRIRLDYQPSDAVKFDIRAGASSIVGGGAVGWNPQLPGTTVGGVLITAVDVNNARIPFASENMGPSVQDKSNVSVKADFTFDWATVTSISAYSKISEVVQGKNFPYSSFKDPRNNFGAVTADRTQRGQRNNEAFSQEVRLTSMEDQRLRWQAGIYFLTSKNRFALAQGQNVAGVILPTDGINGPGSANPTFLFDDSMNRVRNIAPFANIEYDVMEDLEFNLAVRYDTEKRKVRTLTPDIPNVVAGASTYNLCVLNTGLPADQCEKERTFKQLQPKASLLYKLGPGSIFTSYGRGFKSGGFNPIGTRTQLVNAAINAGGDPSLVFVQDSYDNETADAYEIGFKSAFLDRKLNVNGAVFWTDIENALQFEFFPTGGVLAVSQIDKVRVKGFEIDFNARLTEALTLFGGYGYIDSVIRELRAAPQFEGNRTPSSAKYSAFAGAQYITPVSDNLDLTGRVDYSRSGSMWFDVFHGPGTMRKPVDLVNARLALGSERWEIAAWSQNLFDKRYNSDAIPLLAIRTVSYKAPGRSYGVEATIRF